MSVVISFANIRGKVGKTTIALSMADAFSREKLSVLVVDTDPQAKATSLLYRDDVPPAPIESLLDGRTPIVESVIQNTSIIGVHLIGASLKLMNLERRWRQIFTDPFLLRNALKPAQDVYDVIIVDTPPSLGFLSANALAASDFVFIPVASDSKLSLSGADDMRGFLNEARAANPALTVGGAILTKHDGRRMVSKLVAGTAREFFGSALEASIPPTDDLRKAQANGQTILQYDIDHAVSASFKLLANEIMAVTALSAKTAEVAN